MEKAAKESKLNCRLVSCEDLTKTIKAKRIVENGRIGEVIMVRSNTRGPSKPRVGCMICLKATAPGRGQQPYIDTLRYFTNSEFKTVYASGEISVPPMHLNDYPDFYDNVILCANFVNGAGYD